MQISASKLFFDDTPQVAINENNIINKVQLLFCLNVATPIDIKYNESWNFKN